ncbi:PQQ-binding-like beta-propeller repeat protein [Streptomyces sp. NPDC049555]|uniref:outer membrane protein assembly factor BamB family protein n=1 Tax=Streptomyces sp. NPDC049555 TaxID=3154930 RepID=UPI00343E740D
MLVAGCGTYLLWNASGNDTKPSKNRDGGAAAGSLAWKKTARTEPSKNSDYAPGVWFTATTVVKPEPDMVTSYDLRSGTKQWSLVLSGTLCAASRDSDEGRVFLAVEIDGMCDTVVAVDIERGVQLWSDRVAASAPDGPAADDFRRAKRRVPATVSVSGGIGLIAWASGGKAFRLSDGKVAAALPGEAPCGETGTIGGTQFLIQRSCEGQPPVVRAFDPKSPERPRWSWQGVKGESVEGMLSAHPVVLLLRDTTAHSAHLVTLEDENGKERSRIELRRDHAVLECSSSMSRCPEYLINGDIAYIAGKGATTAYDLGTGRERWTYKADANRTALPVAVNGGHVAIYIPATPERVGELTTVAAATGKLATTVRHSPDLRTAEWHLAHGQSATAHLQRGRLLLVNEGGLESRDSEVVVAVTATR